MIDSATGGSKAGGGVPRGKCFWIERGILAAVCALVIGVYTYTAQSNVLPSGSLRAADNYYNLLVQGFRSGQLSLKKEVPPGFAQLTDPYDPHANYSYRFAPYGLLDMSYYKGKLYLYYGVTPGLILFWPYVVLTGHYLSYGQAVAIFCLVGFLAGAFVLRDLWRRYFAEVSVWVVAAGTLVLGLATGVPVMLARCNVNEVATSCGYAFTMLALAGIWKALHEPQRRCWWLAVASVVYGLAVGARPSLLLGAAILLVPLRQAWREQRKLWVPLLAAVVPMGLIGFGLTVYNYLRFDDALEFGLRYALSPDANLQSARERFGLRYLWPHLRLYFLEPAGWTGRFPFLHNIRVPSLPVGNVGLVEHPFGVLTNIPLVWLALAAPLAWRSRLAETRSTLRGFLAAIAVLFGINTLVLSLFFSANIRYEVEFLPALMLVAAIGILSLERALADRPVWRRAGQGCWAAALALSVVFNLLASVGQCADWHYELGGMLFRQGRLQEAIGHYDQALRLKPDFAEAQNNLGVALAQLGRMPEAVERFEQTLHIKPDYAEAHYNLGLALADLGRLTEAIGHYEQAVRIQPDYAEAHNDLGVALVQAGRPTEAVQHYEQALRIHPDDAEVQYNLGLALEKLGRMQEAIGHYEQALRIRPDFVQAQSDLARARAIP